MTTAVPDSKPEGAKDSSLDGVRAALIVGCIMVAVYLLSAVLKVYEGALLNTFYPGTPQFAFLRALFPSPLATDIAAWQNIVLLQVVPFLLFFYFAVRLRVNSLGGLIPTTVALAAVGALLSVFNLVLGAYQNNIAHLLLNGSFNIPNMTGGESVGGFLGFLVSTPIELWVTFESAVVFAMLGITGIAFGSFAGETPYWILRSWLESSRPFRDEGSVPDDVQPPS